MAGPWEDYKSSPKAETKASGPWDDYAAKKPERQKVEIDGPDLKAAGKGILAFVSGDGGAIGEGVPVLGPLMRKAGEHFAAIGPTLFGDKSYSENLSAIQGANQERQAKFAEENPKIDIARKIVGAVGGAGTIPIPGANVAGPVGGLARVAGTTGLAAADTAARGGSAEDIKNAATFGGGAQAAVEAIPVAGKILGPAAKPIAQGIEALGGKISDTGFGRAAKAIAGNLKNNWKALGGEDQAVKIGQRAMESGAVKLGSSAGAMGRRLEAESSKNWQKVEQAFDAAEEAGVKVSGKDIAARIRQNAERVEKIPNNEGRITALEREAAYYEQKGEFTLREAQSHKNNYEWKKVDKLKDSLGKNGNNLVNRAIGDGIKEAGTSVAPDFVEAYQRAGSYGGMAKVAKATSDQQTRNRSPFSLTDYIVGGAGGTAAAALTGNKQDAALGGFALATANSLARTRGNSALAVSLTRLGRVIETSPATLGKFYGVIEKAAMGGQASLATTHAALMSREPEYRKAIEEQQPQGPGSMPIAPEGPMERRIRRTGE